MENIFKSYLEQRYREQEFSQPKGFEPIVTLSREFGCPSKLIAIKLADTLNKRQQINKTTSWEYINKEVLEEAARKLDINQVFMNSALNSGDIGLMKDVLRSFSPTYVNNFTIKKTLYDVIRTFALKGYRIIVGRGGVAILQGRPQTLHVRLQAPVEWRVKEVSSSKGINEQSAIKMITETDKNRTALIELLLGRKFDHHLFDVSFNCSALSMEEVVRSIISIMEIRKMI
jgi:cytidylate kinase